MHNFIDLTNNIVNIFNKFINEGKCTISVKLPAHDIQIKAEAIQLKAFLNVMKSELCPELSKRDVRKSDNTLLRAFATTNKMLDDKVTKLVIKERSAFPIKGLPRTLKELTVNEIGYSQMPIGILNLTNLLFLDLTKNKISKLPKALGNLKLVKLVLNENMLGESPHLRDWEWINCVNIRCSLVTLSISRNRLKFVPSNLCKLASLVNMDLSFNDFERIPFSIMQLKQLKILNLSNNMLSSLPYTINKLKLDLIDLSMNKLLSESTGLQVIRESHNELSRQIEYRASCLLDIAARTVIKHQIPFMNHNIPLIVKEILFHSPVCANAKCESLSFEMSIVRNINLIELNSKQTVTSDNAKLFAADGPFCSRSCQMATFQKLFKYRPAV